MAKRSIFGNISSLLKQEGLEEDEANFFEGLQIGPMPQRGKIPAPVFFEGLQLGPMPQLPGPTGLPGAAPLPRPGSGVFSGTQIDPVQIGQGGASLGLPPVSPGGIPQPGLEGPGFFGKLLQGFGGPQGLANIAGESLQNVPAPRIPLMQDIGPLGFARDRRRLPIPSFQQGGVVEETGPAFLHRGETVIPDSIRENIMFTHRGSDPYAFPGGGFPDDPFAPGGGFPYPASDPYPIYGPGSRPPSWGDPEHPEGWESSRVYNIINDLIQGRPQGDPGPDWPGLPDIIPPIIAAIANRPRSRPGLGPVPRGGDQREDLCIDPDLGVHPVPCDDENAISLPVYQQGGVVEETGPAIVHKGEVVIPKPPDRGPSETVNVFGEREMVPYSPLQGLDTPAEGGVGAGIEEVIGPSKLSFEKQGRLGRILKGLAQAFKDPEVRDFAGAALVGLIGGGGRKGVRNMAAYNQAMATGREAKAARAEAVRAEAKSAREERRVGFEAEKLKLEERLTTAKEAETKGKDREKRSSDIDEAVAAAIGATARGPTVANSILRARLNRIRGITEEEKELAQVQVDAQFEGISRVTTEGVPIPIPDEGPVKPGRGIFTDAEGAEVLRRGAPKTAAQELVETIKAHNVVRAELNLPPYTRDELDDITSLTKETGDTPTSLIKNLEFIKRWNELQGLSTQEARKEALEFLASRSLDGSLSGSAAMTMAVQIKQRNAASPRPDEGITASSEYEIALKLMADVESLTEPGSTQPEPTGDPYTDTIRALSRMTPEGRAMSISEAEQSGTVPPELLERIKGQFPDEF